MYVVQFIVYLYGFITYTKRAPCVGTLYLELWKAFAWFVLLKAFIVVFFLICIVCMVWS